MKNGISTFVICTGFLWTLPAYAQVKESDSGTDLAPGNHAVEKPFNEVGPSSARDWYIGFGLGTGYGHFTVFNTTDFFGVYNGTVNSLAGVAVAINFQTGRKLTRQLHFGMDISSMNNFLFSDDGRYVQQMTLAAAWKYYLRPNQRGWFAKLGLGVGGFVFYDNLEENPVKEEKEVEHNGLAGLWSVGYAMGDNPDHHYFVTLDYAYTNYLGRPSRGEIQESWYAAVLLGLMWD